MASTKRHHQEQFAEPLRRPGRGRGDRADTLPGLLERYQSKPVPIEVSFREMLPELRYGDRLTHFVHSYPGKLLPHIPHFFLNSYLASDRKGLVVDPFCGSGTVLLESVIAGRDCIGIDANPLACLISLAKTTPIAGPILDLAIGRVMRYAHRPGPAPEAEVVNLEYWFHPHVIKALGRIFYLIQREENPPVKRFLSVCFSSVVRRVSLADPRLSVPVRLRSDQYDTDHPLFERTKQRLKQLKTVNVADQFRQVAMQNALRVAGLHTTGVEGRAHVLQADAKCIPIQSGCSTKSNSAQLVITSPPYAGSQKYIRASSLSLGWLGLCAPDSLKTLDTYMMGREQFRKDQYEDLTLVGDRKSDKMLRKIYAVDPVRACVASSYLNELKSSLSEIRRILTCGGLAVVVLGNSRIAGFEFKTTEYARDLAADLNFKPLLILTDQIHSRGLMTKRNATASVINQETVLVLEKQ